MHDAEEHLETDEEENKGQALLQMMEALQNAFDEEKERTQTHDSKDIRSEDNEKVLRNRKDSWNGVDGKDNVSCLN